MNTLTIGIVTPCYNEDGFKRNFTSIKLEIFHYIN